MNPPDEFQKRAADCMHMARLSRDPESKAMWNRMAARWLRCAETYLSQSLAARDQSPKYHRTSLLVGLGTRSRKQSAAYSAASAQSTVRARATQMRY
jgi:hypothetical protein